MFILDSPRFISLNTILAACSLERKAFALHITPGMCFGGFNKLYLFYSKTSNRKTASGFATFANFLLDINLYIWLILISSRDFAFSFANVTYPKRYMIFFAPFQNLPNLMLNKKFKKLLTPYKYIDTLNHE